MSGIEDLKQNATENVKVDIAGAVAPKHKVILPGNQHPATMGSTDDRVQVDLTAEMPAEPLPDEIHESLAKDILEGENSPFTKYKAEKTREYEERMATYEQEQEMKREEEEEAEMAQEEAQFGTESLAGENVRVATAPVEEQPAPQIAPIINYQEATAPIQEPLTVDPESVSVTEAAAESIKPEEAKEEIESPEIDLNVTEVENAPIIEEEEESTTATVDDDEVLKHLQKLATERLKPVSKALDISSFTVLKKPTANVKSLEETVKAAKWVLPTQDSIVLMKEFLGSELESLREFSEDSASVAQLYRKYKTIYDHIVSAKPATYEAWLKTTPYTDLDHYFFAVYIASFKGANYLPLDCKKKGCEKTFLTEDVDIMRMVKFDTEEAKQKFLELYQTETAPAGKGIYCSEIVPLSNKIAIGFKDASIYSLFEISSLSNKHREQFSSIIEFIPYIDSLYIIHQDTQQLEPIGYKIYADNANKTVVSKIGTFFKVLRNLSVDEFTVIRSYVRSITSKTTGMRYIYPSVDCPYCGTPSEEMSTTAEELVFTRYQLGALANTSLK